MSLPPPAVGGCAFSAGELVAISGSLKDACLAMAQRGGNEARGEGRKHRHRLAHCFKVRKKNRFFKVKKM